MNNLEKAIACDNQGLEQEAVTYYQAAIEDLHHLSARDKERLYCGFASTLRNLRHMEEAEKIIDQGLELFPSHTTLLFFRALTYLDTNHSQQASVDLLKIISRIEEIRANPMLFESSVIYYAKEYSKNRSKSDT